MFYLLSFIVSLASSAGLTYLVRRVALRLGVVDNPDKPVVGRKIHQQPIPLLGGVAIFLAFFFWLFIFQRHFLQGDLVWQQLLAFFLGALIIIIGGSLDDKHNLPAWQQLISPLLAIAVLILGGIKIERISHPFGGVWDLSSLMIISYLIIIIWLLGMMYATKLLDGVDGLVSGVGAIGALIIFLFTLTSRYYQPDLALAGILLVGALLGFLIFNWHPAKIFLGEGGSILVGYLLGVLAIISGGKIAIALLIMGIPMLDLIWTIIRRLAKGQNPFRSADRQHLHHRFLALGLGQRKTVLIFYLFSLSFGLGGLFLQSQGKLWLLIGLVALMLGLLAFFNLYQAKQLKK
ncbi:MAG: glycosyltransferase family 4 protein [Patescibacteria group bacterium]|jgi:UDP-GlcNAc:undecaprenyl-phosphate GlcNAc-1-phosphate transferase